MVWINTVNISLTGVSLLWNDTSAQVSLKTIKYELIYTSYKEGK